MNKNQLQQGDVICQRVEKLPEGAVMRDLSFRGYVLAEGEKTGHRHTTAPNPDVEMYEWDGKMYLKTKSSCTITHEEHQPLTLDPGIWEIGQVFERDHAKQLTERVRD